MNSYRNVCSVCIEWDVYASGDVLWRALYLERFGTLAQVPPRSPTELKEQRARRMRRNRRRQRALCTHGSGDQCNEGRHLERYRQQRQPRVAAQYSRSLQDDFEEEVNAAIDTDRLLGRRRLNTDDAMSTLQAAMGQGSGDLSARSAQLDARVRAKSEGDFSTDFRSLRHNSHSERRTRGQEESNVVRAAGGRGTRSKRGRCRSHFPDMDGSGDSYMAAAEDTDDELQGNLRYPNNSREHAGVIPFRQLAQKSRTEVSEISTGGGAFNCCEPATGVHDATISQQGYLEERTAGASKRDSALLLLSESITDEGTLETIRSSDAVEKEAREPKGMMDSVPENTGGGELNIHKAIFDQSDQGAPVIKTQTSFVQGAPLSLKVNHADEFVAKNEEFQKAEYLGVIDGDPRCGAMPSLESMPPTAVLPHVWRALGSIRSDDSQHSFKSAASEPQPRRADNPSPRTQRGQSFDSTNCAGAAVSSMDAPMKRSYSPLLMMMEHGKSTSGGARDGATHDQRLSASRLAPSPRSRDKYSSWSSTTNFGSCSITPSMSYKSVYYRRLLDPWVGDKVEVAWKGKFRLEAMDVYQGKKFGCA